MCLRNDQFERMATLLPGKAGDPGRSAADNRMFVEAVLWLARTGSPWRDLPSEFGAWNSVYQRFARWSRRGVWHRIFGELAQDEAASACQRERIEAGPAFRMLPMCARCSGRQSISILAEAECHP